MKRYAVVFEQGPSSVGAYVPDLPGCVAVAGSIEEVDRLIREAIVFHIEGLLPSRAGISRRRLPIIAG